jgi:hypothetical protein
MPGAESSESGETPIMSQISQNGTSELTPSLEGESILENLIEECTNRLQAGEPIDVEELTRRHPGYADRIRRLLPSLEMLAEVGRTSLRPPTVDFPTTVPLNPSQSGPFELGDYHVCQIIGRGGMGIVYEAIQISLNRRVALKILPFAAALDPHHLRRFQTEAQARCPTAPYQHRAGVRRRLRARRPFLRDAVDRRPDPRRTDPGET